MGREAPPPEAAFRGVHIDALPSVQKHSAGGSPPPTSRGRASGAVHVKLSSACPTAGWDFRTWGRSAEPLKRSSVGCAALPRVATRGSPAPTPRAGTATRAAGASTRGRRPLRPPPSTGQERVYSARGASPHREPNVTQSSATRGTQSHARKEGTLRSCSLPGRAHGHGQGRQRTATLPSSGLQRRRLTLCCGFPLRFIYPPLPI